MELSLIEQVRLLIQDNTPGLYVISDVELNYLLERNYQSVNRTALDAARIILLNLSMRGDDTVDIFSIKGAKAAEQYRLALVLFLKDPNMNPALTMAQGYFGGVSKSDMEANDANIDNVTVPNVNACSSPTGYFSY